MNPVHLFRMQIIICAVMVKIESEWASRKIEFKAQRVLCKIVFLY